MIDMEVSAKTMELSDFAVDILRKGKIMRKDETPEEMVYRISKALFDVESRFGASGIDINVRRSNFEAMLMDKKIVMSTPIMTNAGSYEQRPLSACTVVPIGNKENMKNIEGLVRRLHIEGMGTGFRLDGLEDPIGVLKYLNSISVDNANSGKEDRPVGNMAIMSVHDPHILEFIRIKNESLKMGNPWKFNLSVDASKDFMEAVINKKTYTLDNGVAIDANEVFELISQMAHSCGDPGLVFMERFNSDNPAPESGSYVSSAPCAEVGLVPGETCQFGYLNLSKFLKNDYGNYAIDYASLDKATKILTRALDNALEISIPKYTYGLSKQVMSERRKIGIGICGLADLLGIIGIPYDSEAGRNLIVDMVARINYTSKLESVALARERGAFGAFKLSKYAKRTGSYIEDRYANVPTRTVTPNMWKSLAYLIKKYGIRNVTTVALPPTGRSALTIDASTGIAPFFSLAEADGRINVNMEKALQDANLLSEELVAAIKSSGRIPDSANIPERLRSSFKTALEISPYASIKMQASLQRVVDDAISNTINLSKDATVEDVKNIYIAAYTEGLKGITIFRDNSIIKGPKQLIRKD